MIRDLPLLVVAIVLLAILITVPACRSDHRVNWSCECDATGEQERVCATEHEAELFTDDLTGECAATPYDADLAACTCRCETDGTRCGWTALSHE